MPRAFLITRRRYDGAADHLDPTEYSGPRSVDYGASDGASECGSGSGSESSSSDCPEELYNLTKLAEVSLAAAAGTLVLQQHAKRDTSGDDPLRLDVPSYQERSGEDRESAGEQEQKEDGASCEEHECPDCGKKYSTSSNLARHRQTHRSLGDKKARRCPHCDKVYVSIPAFSMHVRTHNQGCKCHFCGKCFSRPWLLQGHIRTHTGEKPFKCTICNKAFADKSNLRAHIQTHSNTKPHVCSRCGKAFALKSYLYKHEESSCMRSHNHVVQQQRSESVIVPPPARRISVISPNPEHRPALQPSPKPFDFSDPNRLSAFSRPQPVSLNLAVA